MHNQEFVLPSDYILKLKRKSLRGNDLEKIKKNATKSFEEVAEQLRQYENNYNFTFSGLNSPNKLSSYKLRGKSADEAKKNYKVKMNKVANAVQNIVQKEDEGENTMTETNEKLNDVTTNNESEKGNTFEIPTNSEITKDNPEERIVLLEEHIKDQDSAINDYQENIKVLTESLDKLKAENSGLIEKNSQLTHQIEKDENSEKTQAIADTLIFAEERKRSLVNEAKKNAHDIVTSAELTAEHSAELIVSEARKEANQLRIQNEEAQKVTSATLQEILDLQARLGAFVQENKGAILETHTNEVSEPTPTNEKEVSEPDTNDKVVGFNNYHQEKVEEDDSQMFDFDTNTVEEKTETEENESTTIDDDGKDKEDETPTNNEKNTLFDFIHNKQ